MKEAIVSEGLKVHIVDSPIPTPEPDQVVIKVVVSGTNPKDWKIPMPQHKGRSFNPGDDIAGVVHSVGSNVVGFKRGDRVAAFHEMSAPGGSYAEYAVSWDHTTFHIPKKTTFEEAATIPLPAITAAHGLYQCLGLPPPWRPTTTPIPLIIYGAASAVGSYAIQLARQSNIHPLICIAGRGISYVEELIDKSKGDIVLDYRNGHEQLVQNLKAALQNTGKIQYAFDGVSEHGSFQNICQVLDHKTGKIALITPFGDYKDIPETIEKSTIFAGTAHIGTDPDPWQKKTGMQTGNEEFALAFFRYFSRGLQKGYFKGHPYQVVPGGLAGVQEALQNLKDGKASALKYVLRIGDTEGVLKQVTTAITTGKIFSLSELSLIIIIVREESVDPNYTGFESWKGGTNLTNLPNTASPPSTSKVAPHTFDMAANTRKEQPPAYTSQDYQTSTTGYGAGPATTPVFYQTHSTLALTHLNHINNGMSNTITSSEYQDHTVSIMVLCNGTFEPVVLGIQEDYGKLVDDFHSMLADPSQSRKPIEGWITSMKVVWGKNWQGQDLQLARGYTPITSNNITAMLHLLKSRNGIDYIELS